MNSLKSRKRDVLIHDQTQTSQFFNQRWRGFAIRGERNRDGQQLFLPFARGALGEHVSDVHGESSRAGEACDHRSAVTEFGGHQLLMNTCAE